MRPYCSAAVVALLLGLGASKAFALATESFGNQPLSAKNYETWKGIMPLVNDKARVYETWANGNERLFYKGAVKELNAALAHFAKLEVEKRLVVLRPGPAVLQSFRKTAIPYNWDLHVIGGLAGGFAKDDGQDLEWQKDSVLTICVGGDIDLAKIEVPTGVTFRSAEGRSPEARENGAAQRRIAEFLEQRKKDAK